MSPYIGFHPKALAARTRPGLFIGSNSKTRNPENAINTNYSMHNSNHMWFSNFAGSGGISND